MILDCAKGIFSFIYPPICEICDTKIDPARAGNSTVCESCLNKIMPFMPTVCLKFDDIKIWAVCAYEGIIRDCIHLLKYKSRLDLLKPLNKLLIDFANKYLKTGKFDIIIPVPLHPDRLRERGFNQAELLAKTLAKGTGRPLCRNAIKRVKSTAAQVELSKTQRLANLSGAFKIGDEQAVRGKNILIVDDVFTTGVTIGKCAKALLKAGAKSIEALVLARGM